MLKIKRNKILDFMLEKNMSVSEVADKAKVSEKTIYNIIKKHNTPKVTLAKKIANIFGKSIPEVFEFEEE